MLHGCVVLLLMLGSTSHVSTTPFDTPPPEPPRKVTVLYFRPQELLPAVGSVRISKLPEPSGETPARQPIMTTPVVPTPEKTFAYTETPKPAAPEQPVATVVATAPRKFVPPPTKAAPTKESLQLTGLPDLQPDAPAPIRILPGMEVPNLKKPPPRQAVLPTQAPAKAPAMISEAPPPVPTGKLVPNATFQPPIPNLSPNASVTAVAVSPTANGSMPDSNRGAKISAAPKSGPSSTGPITNPGPDVPGLTIVAETDRPKSSGGPVIPETRYSHQAQTLAVALRPSSRFVPRPIEALFQGRNLYTIVLPQPSLPWYEADWILWFAEAEASTSNPVIRPAVPRRRLEGPAPTGTSPNLRVQFHVRISAAGKLQVLKALSRQPATLIESLSRDLERWEWQAATRMNVPIDIEGVLEIPYGASR